MFSGCASNGSNDTEREGSPTVIPTAPEPPTPTATGTPTGAPAPTATPVPPGSESARLDLDRSELVGLRVDEPSVLGPTTSITPGESVDRETRDGSLSVSTGTTIAEDGRVEWEFDFSRRSEATEVGMTVRLRGSRLAEWRSEVIPHTPIADASVCNHYFCCTNLPERQVSAKLLCRTRALYAANSDRRCWSLSVRP